MVLQTVGVPTLFMLFIMYLAWQYVPPVVSGHVELLQKTGKTLESMDATLRQSNVILTEVNATEQETRAFMLRVCTDHESQGKKLDTIIEQTKNPNKGAP